MSKAFRNWLSTSNIIISVDSREKKNKHILKVWDKYSIKYKIEKLHYCDYRYNDIVIERKKSLSELGINLTKKREQFTNEFDKAFSYEKKFLLIENEYIDNIYQEKYISSVSNTTYLANLLSYESKYNIHVHFLPAKYMADFILRLIYYNERC